jgi:hypothetical protein
MSGISPQQKKDPRKKRAKIKKKKREVKPQWKSSMFSEKRKRG